MSFTVSDMDRWPLGVRKVELIDGEAVFYGSFDEEDVKRAERAFPDHMARIEPWDGERGNLVIS